MRITAQILSVSLLVGVGVAQSAPASQAPKSNSQAPKTQQSKPQSGNNAAKGAVKNPFTPKTAAKSQTPATPAKQSATTHTKTPTPTSGPVHAKAVAPKKPKTVAAKTTPKPKKTTPSLAEAAAAVAQNAPAKLPSPGKRDPFLSPVAAAAARGPAASCSTGKRCLPVEQISLKGIVQTKEGNIAMVENGAKRSYYLRENDALFDGSVVKITSDSVTFRQESSDILGRTVSKEVVKKVSAPAV